MSGPVPAPRRATLDGLLPGAFAVVAGSTDAIVTGVTLDSRDVRAGDLYLALPGRTTHGLAHAADAVRRGATVVATPPGAVAAHAGVRAAIEAARTPDGAAAALVEASGLEGGGAGALARRFFGAPDAALRLVAVTGTDGKTSVCRFVAGALAGLGVRAGYIGTIGWGVAAGAGEALAPSALTTPDAVALVRMLAALRDAGCEAVALEASSHGIAEGRLDGLALDVAVLTNLGRDHLDYHGTRESYAAAKSRLFDVPGLEAAVLNANDALGADLARRLVERAAAGRDAPTVTTYATAPDVPDAIDVIATDIVAGPHGLDFTLVDGQDRTSVRSPLFGRFNVDNLLACHGALRASGIDRVGALRCLGDLAPVPGRMERVAPAGVAAPAGPGAAMASADPDPRPGPVGIVDFAHTADALGAAIAAARAHCPGRLHVVFGCGGDRDPGKRAPMARAAAAADRVTVTDDNPRTEASADILADIVAGFAGTGLDAAGIDIVPDRRAAIEAAVAVAGDADVVLVAGKGHETCQIVGTTRHPFSDRDVLAAALARRTDGAAGGAAGADASSGAPTGVSARAGATA